MSEKLRRFSEDIDLSFDRSDLGYSGSRDPTRDGISRRKADQLIEDLMRAVQTHIGEKFLPTLRAAIAEQLGEPTDGNWSLEIDVADAHTVNFHYPTVLSEAEYGSIAYVTPRVRLEFGARGDRWPTEVRVTRPYAAENYPDFFEDADVSVTVLAAQRTFWEKVTALQAKARLSLLHREERDAHCEKPDRIAGIPAHGVSAEPSHFRLNRLQRSQTFL